MVKSICIVAMINDSEKGFSFSIHLAIAFVMLFIPYGWSSFQHKSSGSATYLEFQRKALKIVFFSIYSYLGAAQYCERNLPGKQVKVIFVMRIDDDF